MSPIRMGRAKVESVSAEQVQTAASALSSGLESGGSMLGSTAVARARAVVDKVGERTSIAGGHTVVALAGATGSGKSSLFNRIVGAQVAEVGARRPTTNRPTAGVWGSESAAELLDWLKVRQRHQVKSFAGDMEASMGALNLDGLVLLDLPDFDSRLTEHRAEADRILDLVDVFVWVTDPQKYADARLHEDYVAMLSGHDAVTITVLNQADRLTPEALAACRSDLTRLLEADGVASSRVIATSAANGSGVMDLTFELASAAQLRTATQQRLLADIRSVATELRSGVAESESQLDEAADADLVGALGRAAGIPTILSAVERDYRREAWLRTGWPFTRWVRAFRPDPLRRLRLDKGRRAAAVGVSAADVRAVLGRSSLPPATPAARSAVDLATRALGDRAGAGLPQPWTDAVSDAVTPPGEDLVDALDQAVMRTPLRARNPLWWKVFGILQWILAVAAAVGVLWLVALIVVGWLQLPSVDTPRLGPFAYPFLLGVGGSLLGFLCGVLAASLARVGARRRRDLIAARLREAVTGVARERIVAPVQAVLDRHRMTREQLEAARRAS